MWNRAFPAMVLEIPMIGKTVLHDDGVDMLDAGNYLFLCYPSVLGDTCMFADW